MTKTAIQWPLVFFSLLATGGAGILACVGLSEFLGVKRRSDFLAIVVALIMIVVGGGLFVFSIGQPSRMMALLTNVTSGSPVSLEFLACGLSLIVAVVYLFIKRGENIVAGKVMGVIAVLIALAFGFVTGYRYEAMPGMAEWHTHTLSIGFLLSFLLFSGFCYGVITSFGRRLHLGGEVEADVSAEAGVSAVAGESAEPGAAAGESAEAQSEVMTEAQWHEERTRVIAKVYAWVMLILAAATTVVDCVHLAMVHLDSSLILYVVLVAVVGGIATLLIALGMLRKPHFVWVYLGLITTFTGGLTFRMFVYLSASPHLLGQSDSIVHNIVQMGCCLFM